MRSWASLVLLSMLCLGAGSTPVVKMPNGLNWAKDGTATGDTVFTRLDPKMQDGVNGLWCSDCACDANGLCIQGVAGVDGAFAYRRHAQWECQCQPGGNGCFECSDLDNCDLCPLVQSCFGCTAQLGDPCTQTLECCEGFCLNGICSVAGGCTAQNGEPCQATSDCCIGFCDGSVCVTVAASTTSTSSTTTTATTGTVSTSTSTSTTTTTTTSTTLAELAATSVAPPFPGSLTHGMPAGRQMICVTMASTLAQTSLTRMAIGTSGSGITSFAIYPDSNGGALIRSITASTPNPGVLTDTVASFTLDADTPYRYCICSTTSSASYTAMYGTVNSEMLNYFTTTIGTSANLCDAVSGTPPASTGAITGNASYKVPLWYLE